MWERLATVRDLGRLQEIASVLVRYGFGDLVRRIGLADALARAGRLLQWSGSGELLRMDTAERVRRALEELGPTFVKLGQVLATRVDLFPPDWIAQFSELQNAVPALPFEQVRGQLERDLGGPATTVFARLDEQPLASASLAQTHRAWLQDGRAVIVKIRRPGIGEVIESDLRLLARLAEIVEARLPDLQRYHPVQVVHWQWTCASLNVQDFVDGISGRDLAAVDRAGLDRATLAREGAAIFLKMVLEDGCFHADPHPGNLFYLPDGRIGLIDFGMIGRLSEQRRFQVGQLLYGLVSQEPELVTDVLLEWSLDVELDEARLQHDIGAFIDQYRGVPLKDLRIGPMLGDITAIVRKYGLTLPADLALMIKALLTLEGMGRQLDPEFDMASAAHPYLRRLAQQRYGPSAVYRRGRRTLFGALELAGALPRDLRRLLLAARRGQLRLNVETRALHGFGDQLDRAVNRLTVGLVTAALIIGSSIVMNSVGGGASRWLLALGACGFLGAGLCGVWILFSILRSGRH